MRAKTKPSVEEAFALAVKGASAAISSQREWCRETFRRILMLRGLDLHSAAVAGDYFIEFLSEVEAQAERILIQAR